MAALVTLSITLKPICINIFILDFFKVVLRTNIFYVHIHEHKLSVNTMVNSIERLVIIECKKYTYTF